MPLANNGGVHIYYERAGDPNGLPLVMVPGLGLSGGSWGPLVDALATRTDLILLDPRGCGKSDKPTGPYTSELVADDVAAVVMHAELRRPAVLLGQSMGGMIAQHAACRHSHLFDRVILVSTYARVDDWSGRIFELREQLVEANQFDLHFRISFMFVFNPRDFRENSATVFEIEKAVTDQDPAAYLEQVRFCLNHDADQLRELRTPTLVLVGEDDRLTSYEQAVELSNLVGGSTLKVIDGASHGMVWTHPGEVAQSVIEFLFPEQVY